MTKSFGLKCLGIAGVLAVAPGVGVSNDVWALHPGSAAFAQTGWCQPGAKVTIQWNGGAYPGVVKAAPDASGKCLIGYDGYGANWDERVGPERIAAAGQRPAAATPTATPATPAAAGKAPATPKLGKYHCVFFINGSLQTTPGFTLKAGGAYSHDNGGGGTVKYNAASGVLDFVGGPLNAQAGKVEPGIVRLYNERRSRTVIDCDSR